MEVVVGGIVFAFFSFLCTAPMWIIAIVAFKSSKPINFWAGSTVTPEEIRDISGYNKENGIMWLIYGMGPFAAGVVGLFDIMAGTIIMIAVCIPGLGFLFWNYKRIYNKYKV